MTNNQLTSGNKANFIEFVALMAVMTSLVAFTIDAILPALSDIGQSLGVVDPNTNQLLISMVFLGLSVGQLVSGPLSDSFGRKIVVYFGLGLFVIGSAMCFFSSSFTVILVGRVLQGLGLGGPRIASIAMIRDQYSGDSMARVMSFVMVVFIIIPALAPAAGLQIMKIGGWRSIFLVFMLFAFFLLIWFHFRQAETHLEKFRVKFSFRKIGQATLFIVKNKTTMAYTLASGLISGVFLGYLNTAQQIFEQHFKLGDLFPRYFAYLAIGLGLASFINGRLVMKMGMQFMSKWSVAGLVLWSWGFLFYLIISSTEPDLFLYMIFLTVALFFIGILFGNLKSLSMEPLGHVAGIGAAIISAMSTLMAVPYSIIIGQSYNDSVFPLVLGFAVCSILAAAIMLWARKVV